MEAAARRWPSLAKMMAAETDVESHDGREIKLLNYIYAHPLLPEMRGSPTKILEVMDEFAGQEDFLINIGEHKARILAELIAKEKPKVFVEAGGYVGYSAIIAADAMRTAAGGSASGLRVWSLEMDPLCASIALNLVHLAGVGEIVRVEVGEAGKTLTRLKNEGGLEHVDMLFLDHVEQLYVQEFRTCEVLGLLKSGAVVVADNVVRPGAPEYRSFVRSHPGLESKGVCGLIMPGELEDELEISRVR